MKKFFTILVLTLTAVNMAFTLPYLTREVTCFPNPEGKVIFDGNYEIKNDIPDGDYVSCITWNSWGYISMEVISMDTEIDQCSISLGYEDECTLTQYLMEIDYYSNYNSTKANAWVMVTIRNRKITKIWIDNQYIIDYDKKWSNYYGHDGGVIISRN